MKEVKMRYDFKVSIYNEHVLSDSHRDTEVKQEHSKTGETSPLKQSSMMSFISDTSPSVDGGSSSPSSASGKIQIDEFKLLLYQQLRVFFKKLHVLEDSSPKKRNPHSCEVIIIN